MAREQNFVTDRSQLVQVVIPASNIQSNTIKLFFSTSNTNSLYGKLITRIRFFGFDHDGDQIFDLSKINGRTIYAPFGNPIIYLTFKDKYNNVLIQNANLYDYAQQCNNVDGAGRRIYAPVRRMAQVIDWQKSYLTMVTLTPVILTTPVVMAMQVSYTYPVLN
jgi:hypothetical protein